MDMSPLVSRQTILRILLNLNDDHQHAQVLGWCDLRKKKCFATQRCLWCSICNKRVMHVKCLKALGRANPECLTCDEIKVKTPYNPRGSGGGGDPNPHDHDDGDEGSNWGRGRQDREREREKKPTREDVISKIASRVLPKLEVKNAHEISAIALKLIWDTWLRQVSHTLNLWSTIAATSFRQHLEDAPSPGGDDPGRDPSNILAKFDLFSDSLKKNAKELLPHAVRES
eukprot:4230597-Amphidinium_carterae.1